MCVWVCIRDSLTCLSQTLPVYLYLVFASRAEIGVTFAALCMCQCACASACSPVTVPCHCGSLSMQEPVLAIELNVPSLFRGVISLAGCSPSRGAGMGVIFRQAGGVVWLASS